MAEPRTPEPALSNPAFAGLSTVAPVSAPPAPIERPIRPPAEPKGGWWWGTGRRKTAVARVRLRPVPEGGKARFLIQLDGKRTKTIEEYFSEDRDRADSTAPLRLTNMLDRVEVFARVDGGGYMGQAGAVMLGVARALRGYDPTLEPTLREHKFLTRDARDVERKKYGQAGARRRFQFSKR